MDSYIFEFIVARERVNKNPDLINVIVEDLPKTMTIQQAKDMWLLCGFKTKEIVEAQDSEETKKAMLEEGFRRYASLSNSEEYIRGNILLSYSHHLYYITWYL